MSGWIRSWRWPGVHFVGWRLLSRRSLSFSSKVKLREMLSWKKPPRHRCSDNSSCCFSQLLLCHNSTSGSNGDKQASVKTRQCTEWFGEQQLWLRWRAFTWRCLIRLHTLLLPMFTVPVLSLFLLPLWGLYSSPPDGTETMLLDERCRLLKQGGSLIDRTFLLGDCWWEMHLP